MYYVQKPEPKPKQLQDTVLMPSIRIAFVVLAFILTFINTDGRTSNTIHAKYNSIEQCFHIRFCLHRKIDIDIQNNKKTKKLLLVIRE